MRTVELIDSKKSINIRETPKELPINRYTDFQKYLVQASGLGSDMASVESHFQRIFRFLGSGLNEEATRETYNLYSNIHLMLNKIDIESVAFNCLVDSITHYKTRVNEDTGKKETVVDHLEHITDYSEAALIALSQRLGGYGLTKEMLSGIVSDVKKKSIQD